MEVGTYINGMNKYLKGRVLLVGGGWCSGRAYFQLCLEHTHLESVRCYRISLDLNSSTSTSWLCDHGLVALPLWLLPQVVFPIVLEA